MCKAMGAALVRDTQGQSVAFVEPFSLSANQTPLLQPPLPSLSSPYQGYLGSVCPCLLKKVSPSLGRGNHE